MLFWRPALKSSITRIAHSVALPCLSQIALRTATSTLGPKAETTSLHSFKVMAMPRSSSTCVFPHAPSSSASSPVGTAWLIIFQLLVLTKSSASGKVLVEGLHRTIISGTHTACPVIGNPCTNEVSAPLSGVPQIKPSSRWRGTCRTRLFCVKTFWMQG